MELLRDREKVAGLLRQVLETYGAELSNDSHKLNALLMDYMPRYTEERTLLVRVLQSGVGAGILRAYGSGTSEKQKALGRCRAMLESEPVFTEEEKDYVLSVLADVLGVTVEKPAGAEPRRETPKKTSKKPRDDWDSWEPEKPSPGDADGWESEPAPKITAASPAVSAPPPSATKKKSFVPKGWLIFAVIAVVVLCGVMLSGHLASSPSLEPVYEMMESGNYAGLRSWFGDKKHRNVYYYQDGEVKDTITSGRGMIVSWYGVYLGEIKNDKRSGQGVQFGFNEEDDSSAYTVTVGQWENNKANGTCEYTCYNDTLNLDGEDVSFNKTYSGNVTDNLFDGDISVTWATSDDTHSGSYTMHAENGELDVLGVDEDGDYIIAYDSDGSYWTETEDELKEQGVWHMY